MSLSFRSPLPPITYIFPPSAVPAAALNGAGTNGSDAHRPLAGSKRSKMLSGRPVLPTMPAAT